MPSKTQGLLLAGPPTRRGCCLRDLQHAGAAACGTSNTQGLLLAGPPTRRGCCLRDLQHAGAAACGTSNTQGLLLVGPPSRRGCCLWDLQHAGAAACGTSNRHEAGLAASCQLPARSRQQPCAALLHAGHMCPSGASTAYLPRATCHVWTTRLGIQQFLHQSFERLSRHLMFRWAGAEPHQRCGACLWLPAHSQQQACITSLCSAQLHASWWEVECSPSASTHLVCKLLMGAPAVLRPLSQPLLRNHVNQALDTVCAGPLM